MTIKKAVLIGTLLATTIALITIGVKTGSFDNKNNEKYKPKILSRNSNAIRVNAEDIPPISYNWLLNETIDLTTFPTSSVSNQKFITNIVGRYSYNGNGHQISPNSQRWFVVSNNKLYYEYTTPIGYYSFLVYENNQWQNTYTDTQYTQEVGIHTNTARIIRFINQPNGDLYAWLLNNATPYYNDNIVISNKRNIVRNISKNNVEFTMPYRQNTDGVIKIYLDTGITHLYINGTKYTNYESVIDIENQDIAIQTNGTPTGNIGYIFMIRYTNTLQPVTPYPDPIVPNVEVIDLKPLMLNILTMPFTFISQAFNVTLWPGTQYEFNISNFILSIIAIATILFIIRLFTSGFSVIGNYTGARNDRALKKSQTKLNNAKAKNIENNTPKKTESHVTIKKEN